MLANKVPINPDRGVVVDSAKADQQTFALIGRRANVGDHAFVPEHFVHAPLVDTGCFALEDERHLDRSLLILRGVMRETNMLPSLFEPNIVVVE